MLELNAAEIARMCGGITSPQFNPSQLINQVTLDSRKAQAQSLFVALKGSHNDGHAYVAKVVLEASGLALVASDFSAELPNLIRVADPVAALGKLAANYRSLFDLPLVAITGSNGKTTLKEMLRSVCIQEFGEPAVLATAGNLNNHLGMPLSLLMLESRHKVAIIEMGMNHSGEIDYLSGLAKPTIACVNNVMFAHAGHFKSLAAIAAAKFEIFAGLTSQGVACLNLSLPFSRQWQADLQAAAIPIFGYADPSGNCFIKEISPAGGVYVTPLGELQLKLQVLGEHNYHNALSAIAISINLGCRLDSIKTGLEAYAGYSGRLERKKASNGALIIDDTYNANPDSVKAALAAIQTLPRPHWFIFADLKELGADELQFHQEIGETLNDYAIDQLITLGDLAQHAAKFFKGAKIHFSTNPDIVEYCQSFLPKEATILIKGSNSMRLYEVAAKLSIK